MHIYSKNDKHYPSVTTIVGYFKPLEVFESLMKWSNFLGFKHMDYVRERDAKAAFGTAVHDSISSLLLNKPIDTDTSTLSLKYLGDYMDAIKYFTKFMADSNISHLSTIFSEETFVSESLGYAGTIDWLGTYKDKKYLFDFKTSSSMHESMKLQLSAYRKLLKTEKDIDIEGAAIVFVSKSGVKIQEVSLDELDKMYLKFEGMFNLFNIYKDELIVTQDDLIDAT